MKKNKVSLVRRAPASNALPARTVREKPAVRKSRASDSADPGESFLASILETFSPRWEW